MLEQRNVAEHQLNYLKTVHGMLELLMQKAYGANKEAMVKDIVQKIEQQTPAQTPQQVHPGGFVDWFVANYDSIVSGEKKWSTSMTKRNFDIQERPIPYQAVLKYVDLIDLFD